MGRRQNWEGVRIASKATVVNAEASPAPRRAALVLFVGVALVVGALGGAVTADAVRTWYPGLAKPAFTPPNWVFGPVWTTLYVMMAVAAWRAWRTGNPARKSATAAWGAQLALNLLWSCLFFGLRSPGAALAEIAVLWVAIVGTTVLFARLDRWAGWLMTPYLAWVSFAAALNWAIWRLN